MDYLFYQNPRYIERMDSDDLYELTLDFQVPLVTTVTFKIYLKNTVSSLWCTHRQKKISSLTFYGIIIKWLRYRCKYKHLRCFPWCVKRATKVHCNNHCRKTYRNCWCGSCILLSYLFVYLFYYFFMLWFCFVCLCLFVIWGWAMLASS